MFFISDFIIVMYNAVNFIKFSQTVYVKKVHTTETHCEQ